MLTMKRLVGSLSVAAAALFVATAANASTTTDQPAAVVIFPKIVLDTSSAPTPSSSWQTPTRTR